MQIWYPRSFHMHNLVAIVLRIYLRILPRFFHACKNPNLSREMSGNSGTFFVGQIRIPEYWSTEKIVKIRALDIYFSFKKSLTISGFSRSNFSLMTSKAMGSLMISKYSLKFKSEQSRNITDSGY